MRKRRYRFFGDDSSDSAGTTIASSDGSTLAQPLTADQTSQLQASVQEAIPQVQYVTYIVVGDEPSSDLMTIDMSQYMSADSYNALMQNLTYLPRLHLQDFLQQYIVPVVAPAYYQIVEKAIINLFNTVNLAYVNANNLSPWTWEATKEENYATENATPLAQNAIYQQLLQNTPGYDPVREQAIATAYQNLPVIAHDGMEIQRQASMMGFLSQMDYDSAESVISAYQGLTPEMNAVLTDPVQMNSVPLDFTSGLALIAGEAPPTAASTTPTTGLTQSSQAAVSSNVNPNLTLEALENAGWGTIQPFTYAVLATLPAEQLALLPPDLMYIYNTGLAAYNASIGQTVNPVVASTTAITTQAAAAQSANTTTVQNINALLATPAPT